jgi:hypothetical protein
MKTLLLYIVLLVLFALAPIIIACSSDSEVTPSDIVTPPSSGWFVEQDYPHPEIPRISSQQLKQMVDNNEPLIIIDARPIYKFNNGYIPQAINLPDEFESQQIAGFLTLPKDRPIIFY